MRIQPSDILFLPSSEMTVPITYKLHSLDNPVGEEEDKCLCSQACSCAGPPGTKFKRST